MRGKVSNIMCKIVRFSFARFFSLFINECVHFDVPKTIFTQEQTPKTKLYVFAHPY
jgi:hypothetical protein